MNTRFGWLRRRRAEREFTGEVHAHIEERIDELVESGLDRGAARHRAHREFGNATAIREQLHEAKAGSSIETLLQDLRLSVRGLLRRPAFTLGVALTLGLGIGAVTTAFTIVDGVLLRRLPYRDPSTLAAVGWIERATEWVPGAPNLQNLTPMWDPAFLQLRERTRSFQTLAALSGSEFHLAGSGTTPDKMRLAGVTEGLLEMLDTKAALGRTFLAGEFETAPRVAMISHAAWQKRFGADPQILGRSLRGLTGVLTVVGVLAADFLPPEAFLAIGEAPELWTPIDVAPSGGMRRVQDLLVMGRLRPGVSVEQARAEVSRIAAGLAADYPASNVQRGVPRRIGVNDLHAQTIGTAGKVLKLFLAAAAVLLLLATINAATLILARSLDRTREFGLRMALGARRLRLVRLLAVESAVLAMTGGAMGVLLAYAGVASVVRFAPLPIPRLDAVTVDGRVWIVAAALSLGTGICAGLLPALRLTGRGPWERLTKAGRTLSEGSPAHLRSVLTGAQIAVAMVLLYATGLLARSFIEMQTADLGFEDRGLLAMEVEVKGSSAWSFQSHWSSWDALLADLRAVPGVASVALTSNVPFESPKWTPRVLLPEDPADVARPNISGYAITPGYLSLVGTEIRTGRDFTAQDSAGAERVAIVNETFARTVLGRKDAVGAVVLWAAGTEWSPGDEWRPPAEWLAGKPAPLRIVGVVEDVVQLRLGEPSRPAIYIPYTQSRPTSPAAVIRAGVPTPSIESALRAAVARFNPRVPEPRSLAPMALPERAVLRFQAAAIGSFALTAVLLAAAGLYGSMLHFVAIRQREFGLRMALGSSRTGIFTFVLRSGGIVSAAGLAGGVAMAAFSAQILSGFLFGVPALDAATLLASGMLLLLVALTACSFPAARAVTVDPAVVLREE